MNPLSSAASYARFQVMRGALRVAPGWVERRMLESAAQAAQSITFTPGRVFVEQLLQFGRDALRQASPRCRRMALENLLAGAITGKRRRTAYHRRTGLQPPYCLIISPTMRCNLSCPDCYAGRYDRGEEMPAALLDRILSEAGAMGMTFMTISGGEPFLRADLVDLMDRRRDMYFQVFTNGTLIDDALADRLAAMGHILPLISVEGFEAETDRRRGAGTFRRISAAMDRLRERGVLFGFSATATRENSELVVSDEFVDFYRGKGCSVGWYLNLMPVGCETDLSRMPTPEQRLHRRRRLLELRQRKPLLLVDLWNDGALVGGCMAAGRYYVHVNVRGDVEPCVFCQFAVDNLGTRSLHEALESPFMRSIRARQPYSHNHLRGCMVIDHPEILREAVQQHGARPTCPGGERLLGPAADDLDRYAGHWADVAEREWVAEGLNAVEAADRARSMKS
jgi:MoaA/NifB/PqqE/SkfB family radical SAM enzyme